jgi:hypothetical protein
MMLHDRATAEKSSEAAMQMTGVGHLAESAAWIRQRRSSIRWSTIWLPCS